MEKIKKPIKNYWNWRSNSFGYDVDKCSSIAYTWESVLNELVSGTDGKRALDVGTGTGQFALYLSRLGFDVTGIDLSEKMIESARQHAATNRFEIDFRTGDAENLDFEDDSFHVLVARNLLWTLPNPEKALKEWQRVIKPGGRLVVSDGFWMNTTWKRIHHLAFKTVKNMFKKGSMIPLRFFCSYAGVLRSLPFYEGMRLTDATNLMKTARFKKIGYYDTSCFGKHPYGGRKDKNRESSFFIAYANK